MTNDSRRRFLRLLSASAALPLLQLSGGMRRALAEEVDPIGLSPAVIKSMEEYDDSIASAKMAVDVFDLEKAALRSLHVGHISYLTNGADDQATVRVNRDGFRRYGIRPRRLVDIEHTDLSIKLFGKQYETPIILCPVGHQGAFNVEAELPVARAARATRHLMTLSTAADTAIEDVVAARGEPVWFQLYAATDWSLTKAMVKRAEAAGSKIMVFTVDGSPVGVHEVLTKIVRQNRKFCEGCHQLSSGAGTNSGPSVVVQAPMQQTRPAGPEAIGTWRTWDYVRRLKDATSMKLLVKGISTREDAELAVEHGADGVWLSNHGGRVYNSGRSTIECVAEMAAGVRGRVPLIVDGGFRRGGDIFKALALGATAVGIGRPYIWGLASFGQEGVQAALDILTNELRLIMQQMGAISVGAINKSFIADRARY